MENKIEDRIKGVMASVFGIDKSAINEDASAATIEGWDSLKHLDLVLAMEEEFNIRFSHKEMSEMLNYKLLCLIIKEKI